MSDLDILDDVLGEVSNGARIPYLGAEVAALSGGLAPTTPNALCARIEAEVRVPRRASGNLWSAAQYVESRKFRATLNTIVERAFAVEDGGPNPIHDWLARVRPPMVVDAWYDDGLLNAFSGPDNWGWVQGVSRNGEWTLIWTRAYDSRGEEVDEARSDWPTLIYKPHGLARKGSSFLISDSDYVEVLTEIDIQTPIPEEVRRRRTGRPFLFLGCRFDDQMLRIFARQIAKRSAENHVAVIEGDLTRMERKFLDEMGIRRIDLPLSAVADHLMVPEG
ncbi:SIR2 family protein [Tropicimonas sp. IMCC34043]|uniref:SIR2 family NAD-dependent protein deacylase n=1 Tax=Tropicimonas sp. IMCC34043 TaxID=2248760 RepID=UPI000E269087|nr:SIR2 family protein [Tropicimonas sp. IMCC34043]